MRKPVEWLVNEYQKNLFAASYAICGNAEDARDAVQDTFIRYYTSKKSLMMNSIYGHGCLEWQ